MSSSQWPFMKEHVSAGGLSSFRTLPGITIAATSRVRQRGGVTQLPSSLLTVFFLSASTNEDGMWERSGVCEFAIQIIIIHVII